MKIIASYSKPEDAHLAASFLNGNGIFATIRDEHIVNLNWFYSNAVGGVKVEVSEYDFEEALELLRLSKKEKGFIVCPHCGSGNVRIRELNLITGICLAIGGFILPIGSKNVDCGDCKASFRLKALKTEQGSDGNADKPSGDERSS